MPVLLKTAPNYGQPDLGERNRYYASLPPRDEGLLGNGIIESYDRFAMFTSEKKGGVGLFALGQLGRVSRERSDGDSGRRLIYVELVFSKLGPRLPLGISDFANLPRVSDGSPIQELNRLLYVNSHEKAAPISNETYAFLANRFD